MSIQEAVARASEYLTAHPDEARYRDSAATARLIDGLRTEVSGAGGEHLVTDMPAGIGGAGSMPSPGWYFRAAAASCVATLVAIRAASVGVALHNVEVTVDSESDDRGILGLDSAIAAGPISTRIEVRLDIESGDTGVGDALIAWAVDHCPVTDAIRRVLPLEVRRR